MLNSRVKQPTNERERAAGTARVKGHRGYEKGRVESRREVAGGGWVGVGGNGGGRVGGEWGVARSSGSIKKGLRRPSLVIRDGRQGRWRFAG